jgi:polysaccharide deacetylase family protein (PEP-CTERM system associated)
MRNALSIDVEDWFHPEFVRHHLKNSYKSQVNNSVPLIMQLLKKLNIKATFFIIGDIARKNPNLVKLIASEGNEIGFHTIDHRPLWELTKPEFNSQLTEFNTILHNILGNSKSIYGFRAPTFSLDNSTKYALDCLQQHGYEYDSSVFPMRMNVYGVNNAPIHIYKTNLKDVSRIDSNSHLFEFPMTVFKIGPIRIPISGGFYLRVLPYFIIKILLKLINRTRPFVIYFHPWEIYSKTPRIEEIGVINYFITYFGINSFLKKIEKLLQDFQFTSIHNIIKTHKK